MIFCFFFNKEKPKEGKLGLHTERRPSAIVSTAEVKAKLTEKKFEAEPKQNIPTAKPEPVKSFPIEEASVETLEVGSSMIETVELSSSSFMDQSSSKKAKLQFDVEDVLDEGDLEPPTALQPVVDDLMIDWGSVCSICCRFVFLFIVFYWLSLFAINLSLSQSVSYSVSLYHLLWWRANAPNVSIETHYGDQCMSSTQLITLKITCCYTLPLTVAQEFL